MISFNSLQYVFPTITCAAKNFIQPQECACERTANLLRQTRISRYRRNERAWRFEIAGNGSETAHEPSRPGSEGPGSGREAPRTINPGTASGARRSGEGAGRQRDAAARGAGRRGSILRGEQLGRGREEPRGTSGAASRGAGRGRAADRGRAAGPGAAPGRREAAAAPPQRGN